MSASTRLIVWILVVAALAIGFWMLLLGPKREEVSKLSEHEGQLRVVLSEAEAKAVAAEAAKREFPKDYRQLVVLGQAAPAGDETASLLVELNRIADTSKVTFESFLLSGSGEAAASAAPAAPATPATPPPGSTPGAVPAAATVPPTEAAASMMPLGASVGTAGLAVMPYSLTFRGTFFEVADFIEEIDSLIDTSDGKVAVDGRLMTLDGFALNTSEESESQLNAAFTVTTYLTPPSQGITAGATPAEPAPATAAPTSTTEATPGSDAQ